MGLPDGCPPSGGVGHAVGPLGGGRSKSAHGPEFAPAHAAVAPVNTLVLHGLGAQFAARVVSGAAVGWQ